MLDSKQQPNQALFLDRDGVINYDYGYVHEINNFKFYAGIFTLAKTASEQGYKIVVVTNQAGIGRGLYSENCFKELTNWMCSQFQDNGVTIDKIYFSPYHPIDGIGKYKKEHSFRKPNPGMLLQAQKDLNLNLRNSIMIGDKLSDMQAGRAAGIQKNFLFTADVLDIKNDNYETINSLEDATEYLLSNAKV
ncbi:HAD family hydrolase [Pseudomonadota bacterium]|jgi:D-glycero-D-manno-heptose 1,7-bisphosphate phosphatase|nr:HAD family hydrolase [Pseudomonadota bacterium]